MTSNKDQTTGLLRISGTLDIDSANTLRETLVDRFMHHPHITADLSEVDSCDAAALQVMLAGQRHAASIGKSFSVVAASPAVTEVAIALGFRIGSDDAQGREPAHAS